MAVTEKIRGPSLRAEMVPESPIWLNSGTYHRSCDESRYDSSCSASSCHIGLPGVRTTLFGGWLRRTAAFCGNSHMATKDEVSGGLPQSGAPFPDILRGGLP